VSTSLPEKDRRAERPTSIVEPAFEHTCHDAKVRDPRCACAMSVVAKRMTAPSTCSKHDSVHAACRSSDINRLSGLELAISRKRQRTVRIPCSAMVVAPTRASRNNTRVETPVVSIKHYRTQETLHDTVIETIRLRTDVLWLMRHQSEEFRAVRPRRGLRIELSIICGEEGGIGINTSSDWTCRGFPSTRRPVGGANSHDPAHCLHDLHGLKYSCRQMMPRGPAFLMVSL